MKSGDKDNESLWSEHDLCCDTHLPQLLEGRQYTTKNSHFSARKSESALLFDSLLLTPRARSCMQHLFPSILRHMKSGACNLPKS